MSLHGHTRGYILDRAGELASRVGLVGLTIGALAHYLRRPKSTVYSHFNAKGQLQLELLEHAAEEFAREVIRPALDAPKGLPRLRRIFDRWLDWDRRGIYPGGCLFVRTAAEFDDLPRPVRERLLRLNQFWLHLLGNQVGAAIRRGTLPPATDPDQFLQELLGIMLAFHHSDRLLHAPDAERRARYAFAILLGLKRAA